MLTVIIMFVLAGMHKVEAQPSQAPLPAVLPLPSSMKARTSHTHAGGAIIITHHPRTLGEDEALLRGATPDESAAWFSTSPVKVRLQDGTEVMRLLVLRWQPTRVRTDNNARSASWTLVSDYRDQERAFAVDLQTAPPEMLTRPLTLEALGREARALPLSPAAEQVGKVKLRQTLGKRTLSFLYVKRATEGPVDRQHPEDTDTGIALGYGLSEGKLVLNGSATDLAKLWNAAAFHELSEDAGIKAKMVFEKKAIVTVPAGAPEPPSPAR
jgi:hypothetical protein